MGLFSSRAIEVLPEPSSPLFIYSYSYVINVLFMTNLQTGEEYYIQVPTHQFLVGCTLTELPGGSLFVTGGDPIASMPFTGEDPAVRDVVRIDTRREYAVSHLPPMRTARYFHCAVYHSQYLYVAGGYVLSTDLHSCERYSFAEKRWTRLPPLPQSRFWMNGVAKWGSLYIVGGSYREGYSDLIMKMSFDQLTWEVLRTKLPRVDKSMALFTHDNQIYFVVNDSLYSLQPLQYIKTFPKEITSFFGPSFYRHGFLYCSVWSGEAERTEIGSLIN
jgi:hypothetical protein